MKKHVCAALCLCIAALLFAAGCSAEKRADAPNTETEPQSLTEAVTDDAGPQTLRVVSKELHIDDFTPYYDLEDYAAAEKNGGFPAAAAFCGNLMIGEYSVGPVPELRSQNSYWGYYDIDNRTLHAIGKIDFSIPNASWDCQVIMHDTDYYKIWSIGESTDPFVLRLYKVSAADDSVRAVKDVENATASTDLAKLDKDHSCISPSRGRRTAR